MLTWHFVPSEQLRVESSPRDHTVWKLFECIFQKILETFQQSSQTMDVYGQHTGLPKKGELAGKAILE